MISLNQIIVCLPCVITVQTVITLGKLLNVALRVRNGECVLCAELNLAVSAGMQVGEMRFLFSRLLHLQRGRNEIKSSLKSDEVWLSSTG